MNFKILDKNSQKEVTELFTSAFTSSEGEEEGLLIGSLTLKLSSNIDDQEKVCVITQTFPIFPTKKLIFYI